MMEVFTPLELGIIVAGYLFLAAYMFFAGAYGFIKNEKENPNYDREATLRRIQDHSFILGACCLFWPVTFVFAVVILSGSKLIDFLEKIA